MNSRSLYETKNFIDKKNLKLTNYNIQQSSLREIKKNK